MTITTTAASALSFDELLALFNRGYEQYVVPMHMAAEQFQAHLRSTDIDLDASRLALDDDEPVGMALLGVRGAAGWVGGVGIVQSHRNRGIGRLLMTVLHESARAAGLATVQLEVITRNEAAYHLYQKVGYQTVRRLDILKRSAQSPAHSEAESAVESLAVTEALAATEALAHYDRLHTIPSPWQRAPETLLKQVESLSAWGIVEQGHVRAYAIASVQPTAVRWQDAAAEDTALLRDLVEAVHAQYPQADGSIVNLGEDDPLRGVLHDEGYQPMLSQWEMLLTL